MTQAFASTPRKLALGIALIATGTLIALALAAGPADSKNSVVIGPVRDVAKPTCPTPKSNPQSYEVCNAFGHVTGFQLRTAKQRAVHKIRQNGHIVAWGISLGNPGKDSTDRQFFEQELKDETLKRYGSEPVANISILNKKKKDRFKLAKQSPVVSLKSSLGKKPTFTLGKPLKVKKGQIVALSTPTWVTNFAAQAPGRPQFLSQKNVWRASRDPKRCSGEDLNGDGEISGPDEIANLTKRSHPQYKKGSTRTYGCIYTEAQILYWAYFVPGGGGGKGGGKGGDNGGKGGKGGDGGDRRRTLARATLIGPSGGGISAQP